MSIAKLSIAESGMLSGQVTISGSKNAVLPILAATLLTSEPVVLSNIPHLRDVTTMCNLIGQLGGRLTIGETLNVEVTNDQIHTRVAPYELVRTMRASILVLGPLLAHFGEVKVSLPGGCAIGARPVDMHIDALRSLGAKIEIVDGFIHATADNGLKGAEIRFPKVTVTGTENILMAAALASGITTIHNAACEPEVSDLAFFLNKLGAKISGIGSPTLTVEGVSKLHGGVYEVMADRIEAGTYLFAGVITKGQVRVNSVNPDYMQSTLDVLRSADIDIAQGEDWVEVNMHGRRPKAMSVTTAPYPGFATDMQAQLMAINAIADGESSIHETIFENRFMHVAELQRMGANIQLDGNWARVVGVPELRSCPVMATDLRASAGLVLAALVAKGDQPTIIDRVYHIDRGYECIEEKFKQLGARVNRIV